MSTPILAISRNQDAFDVYIAAGAHTTQQWGEMLGQAVNQIVTTVAPSEREDAAQEILAWITAGVITNLHATQDAAFDPRDYV